MASYAAFLGNNPQLSIAELAAVLPDIRKERLFPMNVLTFQTNADLSQAFLNTLGGTIVIAKKITDDVVTLADIPSLLSTELKTVKGKATFALRAVGVSPRKIGDLYRECKQRLKQGGVSSRYLGNEREAAKPVLLHDEGMLDPKSGAELVILSDHNEFWVGRTVGAQDIKAYTLRDMEKPVRDTTVGLLPPKLAQILLNFGAFLSQSSKPKAQSLTVFDPFCGTGVIPLEAMLRGWHVLASDNAQKAVTGCEKNIEWTRKTFKIGKKDLTSTVWKQDATKPFELPEKPTMIVTEGTLGPALRSRPTVKDAESYCRAAEDLTARFLENCAKTLPGVPVVMTLPVWYAQKKMVHLTKVWDAATKYDFRATLPPHTDPWAEGRFSLLYRRSDQFVGREIVLLKPRAK